MWKLVDNIAVRPSQSVKPWEWGRKRINDHLLSHYLEFGASVPQEWFTQKGGEALAKYLAKYSIRKAMPPKVLYHSTDSDQREGIDLNGLDPAYDQTAHGAIYLAETPIGAGEPDIDVWRVYTQGLDLRPDISTPGFNDWWMTYDKIPRDRLELMEPQELELVAHLQYDEA